MNSNRRATAARNQNGTLRFPSDTSLRLRYASIAEYPELIPVLLSARAAVVEAFDIDESRQGDLILVLEEVAVEAMVAAYAPLVLAAAHLSRQTEDSRSAQAARVAQAADSMATWTGEIAARLQKDDHESAARAASQVSGAADQEAPHTPGIGAAQAAEVAAAVHSQARVRAAERAVAAQLVAKRAAAAALKVASDASAAAVLVERQAFDAATTVHSIGLKMCYEVAIDAAANAAHQALAKTRDNVNEA